MKYPNILLISTLLIGLMKSVDAYSNDCLPIVTPESVDEITYISGGIGVCEARMMRSLAKDYPLDVMFIQKIGQREEFLADVKVQIRNRYRRLLLTVATEGPYLFAKLPQGKYLIVAEYNGIVKQQWVHVISDKNHRVLFWWPILTMS